jgi:molybdopterin biosynthesis enzyme MoaB
MPDNLLARADRHSLPPAGTRGKCLIVNLPGRPSAIDVCLNAVFPAIPFASI